MWPPISSPWPPITHDPDDIAAFGDQVVHVVGGRVQPHTAFTGYARSSY
ncbi:hypothetical protein [Paraburkholderia gardini]